MKLLDLYNEIKINHPFNIHNINWDYDTARQSSDDDEGSVWKIWGELNGKQYYGRLWVPWIEDEDTGEMDDYSLYNEDNELMVLYDITDEDNPIEIEI